MSSSASVCACAAALAVLDILEKEDKLTLYPLTFEIDSYLNKFKLENWEWSDIINNADFSLKEKTKTESFFGQEKDSDPTEPMNTAGLTGAEHGAGFMPKRWNCFVRKKKKSRKTNATALRQKPAM